MRIKIYFLFVGLCFCLISLKAENENTNIIPNDKSKESTSNTSKQKTENDQDLVGVFFSLIQWDENLDTDSLLLLLEGNKNIDSLHVNFNITKQYVTTKGKETKKEKNGFKTNSIIINKDLDSFDKMWQDIIGTAWFGGYGENNNNNSNSDSKKYNLAHPPKTK